jgi:uncharacterized peroxidase-related enzyme
MTDFTLHTIDSAPEQSKPLLEQSQKDMGMIPGLFSVLAESPQIFTAYKQLHQHFVQSSFNEEELTVVWQTINVEHECHYCVPAHTAIANSMKVDPAITNALRDRTELEDPKLQALRDFTLAMVRERGNVSQKQLDDFYSAGYAPKQVLEVILGLSQKVISNYVNRVAKTELDPAFQPYVWTK